MKTFSSRLLVVAVIAATAFATARVAEAQTRRRQSEDSNTLFSVFKDYQRAKNRSARPVAQRQQTARAAKTATPRDLDVAIGPQRRAPSAASFVQVSDTGASPRLSSRVDPGIDFAQFCAMSGSGELGCCPTNDCGLGCCDAGCCDAGCCDSGCCGDCCGCCPPCCPSWAHQTMFFGECLYLTVSDADVNHAQQQNGLGGAGTVPFGLIGRVDPDWEPGFRVGGAIRLTDCSSLFVAYSQYESNAVSTLVPPVIPGGGGAVGAFVHHPGAAITASVGPVNATYDVDFQLGDFGLRRIWRAGSNYAVNWSLGGRYGHLEQNFQQLGVYSGGSAGQINTRTNVDFDGGGLRFGLDGERRFGCRGFSVYANVNVAPMLGTVQADYNMQNVTTATQLARATWKDDRFITTLDYEGGLAWTSRKGRVRLSAGYNVAHWFNAVTTDSFINGVRADSYADIDGGLTFTGLVARAQVGF